MFGWFMNTMMTGLMTTRAHSRLAREFGPGRVSETLAVALGHACYPTASPGDRGFKDAITTVLKRVSPGPCQSASACKFVESWLDLGQISTEQVFQQVWSTSPAALLQSLAGEPPQRQ
jgi:hypothetical protein